MYAAVVPRFVSSLPQAAHDLRGRKPSRDFTYVENGSRRTCPPPVPAGVLRRLIRACGGSTSVTDVFRLRESVGEALRVERATSRPGRGDAGLPRLDRPGASIPGVRSDRRGRESERSRNGNVPAPSPTMTARAPHSQLSHRSCPGFYLT
jgi:hypothetical protein